MRVLGIFFPPNQLYNTYINLSKLIFLENKIFFMIMNVNLTYFKLNKSKLLLEKAK